MIICYHKVHPEVKSYWYVSVDQFDRHMAALRAYDVVYLNDYDPRNPKHAVITFDGIYGNVAEYALPILEKYGYPFELFVVGDYIGRDNDFDQHVEPPCTFASYDQLKLLVSKGGRVQWHTATHNRLAGLIGDALDRELEPSEPLRAIFPTPHLDWFAYPHGEHDAKVVAQVEARFKGALACDDGDDNNRYRLTRHLLAEKHTLFKNKVSLIVANYNYGHLLPDAMESVFNQTIPPDEILIIDDASEDASKDVIKQYEGRAKIVINEQNLGIVENFRKAVSLTTGEYIAFLGADNRIRGDYIERMRAALDMHPNAAVAYSDMLLFGPRAALLAEQVGAKPFGRSTNENWQLYHWEFPEPTGEALANLGKRNFIHGSSMYRRADYEAVGGYRKTSGPEDHDLFYRMILQGRDAVRVPFPILEYRQHSTAQANTVLLLEGKIVELRNLYSQKMQLIESLREEIARTIAEKEQTLAARGQALAAKEQALAAKDQALAAKDQALVRSQRALRNTKKILKKAEASLKTMRAQRDRLRKELDALRSSASWRMTAPLRYVASRYPEPARMAAKVLRIGWWTVTFQLRRRWEERRKARAEVQNTLELAKKLVEAKLFDRDWYLKHNPKLAKSNASEIEAAIHYLKQGSKKGQRPNRLFDPKWYVAEYPDVAKAGMNPLVHYLVTGSKEGRKPNSIFDPKWYVAEYPDVAETGLEPLAHYLTFGSVAKRKPSPLFDPNWYLEEYPDVAEAGSDALDHYLSYGSAEGRIPSSEWLRRNDEQRARVLGLTAPLRTTKIAIGIVTYNNPSEDLARCLNSIYVALSEFGAENQFSIFMIDNGEPSTVDPKLYPALKILDSVGNVGFGAGHNRLMKAAFSDEGTRYYMAVNPDGMLEPKAIKALISMAQASDDHALVEAIQFPVEHPKKYDTVEFDTPWASGACLLVPRPIYESIGGFDENFFMYCEDVDLSWRAYAAGFKVKICPRALFFHPTHDRTFNLNIHARFLAAGVTLARKWGGAQFEMALMEQASRHGIDLSNTPAMDPIEQIPPVVTFDYGFHFSPARW